VGDAGRTVLHSTCSTRTSLIRALILAITSVTSWSLVAWAAEPGALVSIRAIRSLTKAEIQRGLPVAFQGTITYYNPGDVDLFVQEGGEAVYVQTKQNQNLLPGDRVLVRGKTRASFTVDVVGDSVTVLHHGTLPKSVPADFGQLIRAERDCMLVTVRATVRSADTMYFGNTQEIYLKLLLNGGYIDAVVVGSDPNILKDLPDAEVEVTGAVSGKFDSKMQLIGVLLEVPDPANLRILERAQTSVDSLPMTPMDKILSNYSVEDRTRRVRVRGTITYYRPASVVVLQNGDKSLWISTHASNPMQIGDIADATGFPDARSGFLALDDGEVQDTHVFQPITPQPSIWRHLADWNSGDANGHQNDLVSIEGEVVAAVREESQDEFDLISDGKLFTAIYRHPPDNRFLLPMKQVPAGARIRVTGICMVAQANDIDPSSQEVPFNILMRSFDDISLVASPPILNVHNLTVLAGLLLVLFLAAGARAWIAERIVRHQNAEAAYSERRRGRILEDMNGSRSLAEIIEEITELVSFKLQSAPCWCKIVDGAQLGNWPPDLAPFRIVSEPISARTGPPLGTIYAAFDPLTKPRAKERETLSMAAGLATLAIETRRLYSDLLHRSEFDLLTDIHNRFSLESYLETQIELARQNAGIFGLIYVDLDRFKQVNDLFGHQVGDFYLREVAHRMLGQLRPHDMLARIGGDEFAVLLPKVRNRAEVEEIAHRLQRCLTEPFAGEGYAIHGSASVGIALYPEDGATKDGLLNFADAEMYVNKSERRETEALPDVHSHPGLTPENRT
jgi:diguanylate cyclase (GGDEF)-like protein